MEQNSFFAFCSSRCSTWNAKNPLYSWGFCDFVPFFVPLNWNKKRGVFGRYFGGCSTQQWNAGRWEMQAAQRCWKMQAQETTPKNGLPLMFFGPHVDPIGIQQTKSSRTICCKPFVYRGKMVGGTRFELVTPCV